MPNPPPRQVIVPFADVREVPQDKAPRGKMESQLVFGECFYVEAEEGDWCRGRCVHDDYPGYVRGDYLSDKALAATHVVTAARSHSHAEATIKSRVLQTWSFGSKLRVVEENADYARIEDGSWIYRKHLSPRASADPDFVETAKRFLETPYYWGGRSGFGIDCSGLVQVSLARAGIKAARDTEQQITSIGVAAEGAPQRGDIVFFPGHVGIMADEKNILHANAHHMKVIIEPLDAVTERSKGITAIRRVQRG